MNYRHAYHAGNFADVLKHVVLTRCLMHLRRKAAPFSVIDTHAGAGRTRLDRAEASATGEWLSGVARVYGPDAAFLPPAVAELFGPYFAAIAAENPDGDLAVYPGSPVISRGLLRSGDRLVANELHPEDGKALRALFNRDKACRVTADDGYQVMKASVPPKERRGLVLIDPPFEAPGELIRMTEALSEGLQRFRTGTYLLWHPIKDEKPVARFHKAIAAVATSARIEAPLKIELFLRPPRNPLILNGCGLVVINPPFTLETELQIILPALAKRLGDNGKGTFNLALLGT
jgi:23S rRNA (adenine2030-N6)-methyltransferase